MAPETTGDRHGCFSGFLGASGKSLVDFFSGIGYGGRGIEGFEEKL